MTTRRLQLVIAFRDLAVCLLRPEEVGIAFNSSNSSLAFSAVLRQTSAQSLKTIGSAML